MTREVSPSTQLSRWDLDKKIPQINKFKESARKLEADEDEARWEAALKKVAKLKPAPEKSAEKDEWSLSAEYAKGR